MLVIRFMCFSCDIAALDVAFFFFFFFFLLVFFLAFVFFVFFIYVDPPQ